MVEVIFDDSHLSLKGKCSSLKFVMDDMSKQEKKIFLTVYSGL